MSALGSLRTAGSSALVGACTPVTRKVADKRLTKERAPDAPPATGGLPRIGWLMEPVDQGSRREGARDAGHTAHEQVKCMYM